MGKRLGLLGGFAVAAAIWGGLYGIVEKESPHKFFQRSYGILVGAVHEILGIKGSAGGNGDDDGRKKNFRRIAHYIRGHHLLLDDIIDESLISGDGVEYQCVGGMELLDGTEIWHRRDGKLTDSHGRIYDKFGFVLDKDGRTLYNLADKFRDLFD